MFECTELCWIRRFYNRGSFVIPSNSNCKLERIEGCFANYTQTGDEKGNVTNIDSYNDVHFYKKAADDL